MRQLATQVAEDELSLLDEKDVSRLFAVPKATLRNWRSARIGPPFVKIGPGRNGQVRYRRSELVAYIAQHRQQTS